jgi:hypothetical protein
MGNMGEPLVALIALVHAGVGAVWFGSMAYSLFVVQPRVGRLLPTDTAEDVYRELANGNRWRVVALIAVLALSGMGLVLAPDGRPALWWALVGAKAVLLIAATALFWWVSWRGWPRRVFALPEEVPAVQRRFRLVAITMCGLVGSGFALGVLAGRVG